MIEDLMTEENEVKDEAFLSIRVGKSGQQSFEPSRKSQRPNRADDSIFSKG